MLESPACLKREFHLTHLCGMNELTVALICTFQRYLPFWCQYFICWPFVFLARILFISFTFIQYMSWNHLRLPQSASEWIITKNIKRREIWKLQFQFFRYISWNNLRLPQNASEWIITKNVRQREIWIWKLQFQVEEVFQTCSSESLRKCLKLCSGEENMIRA